jgi:hypothetical protein
MQESASSSVAQRRYGPRWPVAIPLTPWGIWRFLKIRRVAIHLARKEIPPSEGGHSFEICDEDLVVVGGPYPGYWAYWRTAEKALYELGEVSSHWGGKGLLYRHVAEPDTVVLGSTKD